MGVSYEKREEMQNRYHTYDQKIDTVKAAITDIIHGESELSVCIKYKLDLNKFRRFLSMNIEAETSHPNDFAFENTPEGYNWRQKFLQDLTNTKIVQIVDRFDEQFENVTQILTPVERKIIVRYYICEMSLNEISIELNMSREGARQSKAKALHKLRQKEYLYPLLYDKKYVDEYRDRTTKLTEIQKDIRNVNDAILQSQMKLTKQKTILKSMKKALDEIAQNDVEFNADSTNCILIVLENTPIKTMNLSTRAVNALTRAKIKTAADIMNYTYDDLIHLQNLGVTTVNEIIEKMHSLGATNFPKE